MSNENYSAHSYAKEETKFKFYGDFAQWKMDKRVWLSIKKVSASTHFYLPQKTICLWFPYLYISKIFLEKLFLAFSGYGLEDQWAVIRVPVTSGVHPAFYPMGTGALSKGVKRQVREAVYSPPTSAEIKKT
jgi:hypothetical protein